MTFELYYHSWEKIVQEPSNRFIKLVVDVKRIIHLDGEPTGFKLCANGNIHTMEGEFVSDLTVEQFLINKGLIKWLFSNKKTHPKGRVFLFFHWKMHHHTWK